ncbi:alpha/beta-hydrolase [Coprinopsis marcescibilis]|uniref:Alpha/beta-hydrolase n=1 Tax=Coprinopsis marcescibilis TaxID=230819 RepID=A0A5C3KPD4_COPMA|nr:alpha/beta-hydrolase [Coprinopsis marcescibilis]
MSQKPYTEAWLTGPRSTQFYTRSYIPPSNPIRAVVAFVHGFAEHVGRYGHLHPLLAQRGIAVFAYDQRGFGLTAQDTSGKKSKDSAYGKTCWNDQMKDIQWALEHTKKQFADVPLFLMGHSMGGAESLGFATDPEHKDLLTQIAGVIATGPLIAQTTPAPSLMKWVGGKASILFPNALVPAAVNAGDLSHDEDFNSAYLKDPLIQQAGSLKGLADMLSKGEELRDHRHKNWPPALPVLIVHGTDDKVTCPKTSRGFFDAIPAAKKRYESFEGGYHELQNEPNGVKEKLVEVIVNFVEEHLPSSSSSPPIQKASL